MSNAIVHAVAGMWVAVAGLGCGEEGIAPRTFCFEVNRVETCIPQERITATQSLSSSNRWFRILGAVDIDAADELGEPTTVERTVELSGQVPEGVSGTQPATNVVLSLPFRASCDRTRLIDPFGRCSRDVLPTVCELRSVYDEPGVHLSVVTADDFELVATFEGHLRLPSPPRCCSNDEECVAEASAAVVDLPADHEVTRGRLHLTW